MGKLILNTFSASKLNEKLILLIIFTLITVSWYYMVFMMSMNMAPISHWSTLDILLLFIMWSIMMAGMMLPSALPVILLVEKINQNRKIRKAKYSHTLYFVLGYLLSWTLYSFIITLVQYGLHYLSILSPMMISAQKWFTCLLLFSAGVYQWLPIKQRCLKLCRSPLSFIITQWQEGTLNSIKIGFKHGQYCIGCCWVLMALLFVAGVMDLKWILALTVIVLIEKLAPYGAVFSKILGIGLILSCVFILVRFHYS